MVWHKDTALPAGLDMVGIPGGFSFGDYLRCGAIAAQSPICRAVVRFAEQGGYVLGICNGFQVLTETGLLPGALMRNAGLKFICKSVPLTVATADSAFTCGYSKGQHVQFPDRASRWQLCRRRRPAGAAAGRGPDRLHL